MTHTQHPTLTTHLIGFKFKREQCNFCDDTKPYNCKTLKRHIVIFSSNEVHLVYSSNETLQEIQQTASDLSSKTQPNVACLKNISEFIRSLFMLQWNNNKDFG